MALTPEDVVNKRFETTRFRDGYDQDEVDDFLDEVVAELRRLVAENDELRAQLGSQSGEAPAAAVVEEAPAVVETETVTAEVVAEPEPEAEPVAEAAPAEVQAAPTVSTAAAGADSLLALAQRVHDEHVAEGEQQRDALIAAAEEKAKAIEDAAAERQDVLAKEFDAKKAELEGKKAELESKLDELKSFERDYRLKLRGYIESQLRDLDRSSSLAFGGPGNAN